MMVGVVVWRLRQRRTHARVRLPHTIPLPFPLHARTHNKNKVDLLIVVTSAVLIPLDNASLRIIEALRVLRALKPLRVLTRSAGMRLVLRAVTLSIAAMANVSAVCLLFFVIFAVLGVQLLSGKMHACNDAAVAPRAECVGEYFDPDAMQVGLLRDARVVLFMCRARVVTTLPPQQTKQKQVTPRAWVNAPYNFDHLGNALLSLFVFSSLNGYAELSDAMLAAPSDKGAASRRHQGAALFLYELAFVVVVAFTLLNLYIGVVFRQFNAIRTRSTTGSAFLTPQQQEWAEMSRMVFRLRPPEKAPPPRNALRL